MTSSYLDELDRLLLNQPNDCMLLSELDGFLTGIAISPDLISPGDWLARIWSGDDGQGKPEFEGMSGLQRFIDLVMRHYNEILASLDHSGGYEPVLETDTRTGETLWEMWVDGFGEAMDMAPAGWVRLAADDDAACAAAVAGIRTLCEIASGEGDFPREEERRWTREAPDLIPIWVELLHQWRLDNDPHRPAAVKRSKVGRNDPCPCGSGKKYKKCCGLN